MLAIQEQPPKTARQSKSPKQFQLLEVSACADRRPENVCVEAVVIAELKFRDVQRHVLLADLMESADNTALDNGAEALNRIGVNRAASVKSRMIDGALATTASAEALRAKAAASILPFTRPHGLLRTPVAHSRDR